MSHELPLAADVAATLREEDLLRPGERVLVAASGGGDSSALAVALVEAAAHGLPLEVILGHVDHGWRGQLEAARDRRTVEQLAEHLGIRLVVSDPPPRPVPTEDAARRWRYHELDRMAREAGAGKIATGHHLRDQAETVWMRLERGSGRVGLKGIPMRRPLGAAGVEVVRPLLRIHPERLRALLQARGVTWRDDPTNRDLTRDRARVRERLLEIERSGRAASKRLAEFAERLTARLDRRAALLEDHLREGLRVHAPACAVEIPRRDLAFLSAPDLDLALRFIGRALRADRDGPFFTRRHVVEIREAIHRGGAVDLPRGLRLAVDGSRVWLRPQRLPTNPRLPRLLREDVTVHVFDLEAFLAVRAPAEAAVDADRLGDETTLRFPRKGDVFRPHGGSHDRPVDLDRWLGRQRVPGWLRPYRVLLEGGGSVGIAWVAGLRIARSVAVTPDTRRVALLALEHPPV